jgi:hypothetical protein
MKDNIKSIQSLRIQINGFFVIGWDEDTPETCQRTLEFCDECSVTPFIFTLNPMPGSQIYREYLQQGRILKRTLNMMKARPSPGMLMASFFTQFGIKKSYTQLYSSKP